MLSSLVLYLSPTRPLPLDRHVGRWINGLMYALVEQVSPTLSADLHDGSKPRPFTVSPLLGQREFEAGIPYALPGAQYALRFTTLSQPLYEVMGTVLLQAMMGGQRLRLGETPFVLERVGLAPHEDDPWVATTTFEALARPRTPPPREIAFTFASPTAFKLGEISLLLPHAYNVFGSLQRNWRTFSAVSLPCEDVLPGLDEGLMVSRYNLHTAVIEGGAYKLLGFQGELTYALRSEDVTWKRSLQILADFALFAGVGMKTTQGMGQARRLGPQEE